MHEFVRTHFVKEVFMFRYFHQDEFCQISFLKNFVSTNFVKEVFLATLLTLYVVPLLLKVGEDLSL